MTTYNGNVTFSANLNPTVASVPVWIQNGVNGGYVLGPSLVTIDSQGNISTPGTINSAGEVLTSLTVSNSLSGGNVPAIIKNTSNTASSTASVSVATAGTGAGIPYFSSIVSGAFAYSWGTANGIVGSPFAIWPQETPSGSPIFELSTLGALTTAGYTATTGNITTTVGSITSATTLTATAGAITASNGNFVGSSAGTGFVFNAVTASGAASGPVVLNGRVGQVTFTGISIAGGATQTLTMTNSAIASATTQLQYSLSGVTAGAALSVTYTCSAGSVSFVVTNATGATTSVANIAIDFLVKN